MARLVVSDLSYCFDPAYYLDRYPDVRRSGMDPLAHFLLFGAREGRQPDPLFDARYYLAANPDVSAAGANPLIHFLRFGWKEGRRPNLLFDADFYMAHCPALPRGTNPFVHYVTRRRNGEKPRAWPAPVFPEPAVFPEPPVFPKHSYQVATGVDLTETNDSNAVDVIIPVYSGFDETHTCLASLLSADCRTLHNIVLVNDHSLDPELCRYVRDMSAAHGWTLLQNEKNLGFAASVNRGLNLHPDRDVLLLNNDTEVAHNWLDRLRAAAYAGRTGTVTPFSNNATICSYPKMGRPNSLPAGTSVQDLDNAFREVNAGCRIPLPTAVGFCMYIRRDCLNEVGAFRPEVFGKGYGEENDFCLRATYKGWQNVLAADVFVYHRGESSFGAEAESRRKAAAGIISRWYPEYSRTIARYMRNDPARPYRAAVSAWRMRHSEKPAILAISHELGGGMAQHINELREALGGKASMLKLTPGHAGAVVLRNTDPEDDFSLAFDVESDYTALIGWLRRCGISRLHVHHLLGHRLDVVALKKDLGVPMDLSVHDYFLICPQVTLTDAAGRYCGEPDPAGCNVCLAGRPPWPRLDIGGWREKYAPVVNAADRVIAPSRDTADRFRRYFPRANIVMTPHPGPRIPLPEPSPERLGRHQPLVIAVLGAMNIHKGIHRLRAVAAEVRRQKLPLQFVLVGSVDPTIARSEPFLQTGPYPNERLPALLHETGAQVLWFPAQWPETFSYTLSACLETGMPVIVPDIGAFAERVAGRSWTWVVPWDMDTGRLIELFVSVRRDHFVTGVPPPQKTPGEAVVQDDFYYVKYLPKNIPESGFPKVLNH